jgi:DNA-binding transcriptional LysR family regulator
MPLLGLQFMPDVITHFLTQYPGTQVDLFTERSEQVVEDVVTQRVEVGLSLVGDTDQRVQSVAFELPTVCLMPVNHPLAKLKAISLENLQGQALIDYELNDSSRRQLDKLLDEKNISPNRIIQVSFALQAIRLVQNGLGITLIDNITALSLRDAGLTTRPLDLNVMTTVYMLTARDQPTSVVAKDFLPFIIQSLPKQNAS